MTGLVPKLVSAITTRYVARRFSAFSLGPDSDVLAWRIRGGRGCRLLIGESCVVNSRVVFERQNVMLSVGDRCFIGNGVISVAESVEIGNDVLISWGVAITDHNSHSMKFSERQQDVRDWRSSVKNWAGVKVGKVVIQDKAWIGFNTIVLKGVTVGEGAIVGAGSVVSKDVPPFTVVAGNPARVIRELGPDER